MNTHNDKNAAVLAVAAGAAALTQAKKPSPLRMQKWGARMREDDGL